MDRTTCDRKKLFRIIFGIAALAILFAGIAGAATEINSCDSEISSPGEYVLTQDVSKGTWDACITISSSDVIFDGNGHIINGAGAWNSFGIYVNSSVNVTVKNLTLINWDYGIQYRSVQNGSIAGTTAYSNIEADIIIVYSGNINLTNNKLSSAWHGITLIESDNNDLTGNNASSNFIGIYLYFSKNNKLADNSASSNNQCGIYFFKSDNNTIRNSSISGNGCGIWIGNSGQSTFSGNFINSNRFEGILLESSSGNTLYNNYFHNTINAQDDGNNIWNIPKTEGMNIIGGRYIGGNYWSDYTGEDRDGDGLGDTLLPYSSSGNIINGRDYMPLTNKYAPIPVPALTPIGLIALAGLLSGIVIHRIRKRNK